MAAATNARPPPNPTSPQEDRPAAAYAAYVPHDLEYNADFEDSLMTAILSTPPADSGIRIIPENSSEQPVEGESVRFSDISPQSLPAISENELPLPLDDARRVFASPLSGVKLTHPGGYLEGGPGLDPEMDTFPDDFLATHGSRINGAEDLRREIEKEVERHVEELKTRLRARQKAKARNEQIEKDLKALVDQHGLEMKSLQRMAEDAAKKRVARERRKKDRDG